MAEIKPIEFTDSFGDTFPLWLNKGEYSTNNNLYMGSVCNLDGYYEDYADVTTNICYLPPNMACIDTTYCKDLYDTLIARGDATLMGSERSGFNTYPLVHFTNAFLDSLPTCDKLSEHLESLEV